jgi:hypothetical protein
VSTYRCARKSEATSTDLALIFEAAEKAGIVWLKFDSDAAVIDGLQVFKAAEPPR